MFSHMPSLNHGISKVAHQGKTCDTSYVTTFSHSKQPALIIQYFSITGSQEQAACFVTSTLKELFHMSLYISDIKH